MPAVPEASFPLISSDPPAMGAWDIHTFDNDSALDWLGDFMEAPSEDALLKAFTIAKTEKTGLLARIIDGRLPDLAELEGEEVLAAAEVVASLKGRPAPGNPPEIASLPAIPIGPATVAKAIEAIDGILLNSNLKDCWEESDAFPAWLADVNDLRQRLADSL